MIRAPGYRATLAGPAAIICTAAVPKTRACPSAACSPEIREPDCTGSMNLPCRYITPGGRAESGRPHLSPRRVTRLLLTRPDALKDSQQAAVSQLTAACSKMTSLAGLVRSFTAPLRPDPANTDKLREWVQTARTCDLPNVDAFTRGLDLQAVIAGVTLPFHDGRTEGVTTNIGHQRTREGMALAKKNGKLKGKQPKLPEPARRSIRRRYAEGEVSLADLATEYSVGRSTIHRITHGPDNPR